MGFYVRRTFRDGVTSCGGPYESEEDARYMAAHVRPANGYGVAVINERDDPEPTDERPLLLTSTHRAFPHLRVVLGPFRSREHIAEFIGEAFGAAFQGVPMTAPTDWSIVQLEPAEAQRWP